MASTHEPQFLSRDRLQDLLDHLLAAGYTCIGPQVQNGAIVFMEINRAEQLPQGIIDKQSPGSYTLTKTSSPMYFQWTTGPQAIKPYLFTPGETLWEVTRQQDGSLGFHERIPRPKKIALLGVRACDIAGLYLQDKHFLHEDNKDPYYLAHRQQLFLIGVNCTRSSATCFCHSTGDGPALSYGYDLGLTELEDGFILDALSHAGNEILEQLPTQNATDSQNETAEEKVHSAKKQQRKLRGGNLRDLLFSRLNHPHWLDIAKRCLSCGNCTAVCPTCFCHSEMDIPSLDGMHSDHVREWDSCFTVKHSYIHGMTIRAETSQRYRQWLTHKLGSWHEQYGRSGCVGCGRCISWCPVGIDITEEVNALAGSTS